jgi:hypothetical protein
MDPAGAAEPLCALPATVRAWQLVLAVARLCGSTPTSRRACAYDVTGGPRSIRSRVASSGPRNHPSFSIHQVSPAAS